MGSSEAIQPPASLTSKSREIGGRRQGGEIRAKPWLMGPVGRAPACATLNATGGYGQSAAALSLCAHAPTEVLVGRPDPDRVDGARCPEQRSPPRLAATRD